jgi:beta-glucuronidase
MIFCNECYNSILFFMKTGIYISRFLLFSFFFIPRGIYAQTSMTNVSAKNSLSLNGDWQIIVDWYNRGIGMGIYKDKQPENKTVFYEFAFASQILKVPSDCNSHDPKLQYYEGDMWYKKVFDYSEKNGARTFIHFAAVNYSADIFFNGNKIGSHERGFAPFQIELTGMFKDKNNSLVVRLNNQRREDAIPALSFDWWNYGGITRDVTLIETPNDYREDYLIQLEKESHCNIGAWGNICGHGKAQKITISIPDVKTAYTMVADTSGYDYFKAKVKSSYGISLFIKTKNIKSCLS